MAFAELLARSAFSFLRGASLPEEVIETAHRLGLDTVGLCDRDGLYGSVRAFAAAKKLGQKYAVGVELSLSTPETQLRRLLDPSLRAPESWRKRVQYQDTPSLSLLVQNQVGYRNLCRILTEAHAGLPKGLSRLEQPMLHTPCDGLVGIVPVPTQAMAPYVEQWLPVLLDAVGEHAFLAVYRRLDGLDAWREQWALEQSIRWGMPIIASAYPLFHVNERKALADIVHCIRRGTTLEHAGTELNSNCEARLRSEADMLQWFAHAKDWVYRTCDVASTLAFTLRDVQYQFPCVLEPEETADGRLRRLTWQGANQRYDGSVPDTVRAQIEKELTLIAALKVAPYFLCTKEVVEIARERKILCQGRGSAANSAVCYALGVTAVDPARSNLLFERFLSAERNEPPDIDIDFEHERREEVIQEIYRRYGRDHAAMVAEVSCYRGKSALREVAKVFGLPLEQINHLTSMVGYWDGPNVSPEDLVRYGFDPNDTRLVQVIRWARELSGFPRHMSVHVGGFVLSKTPLSEVTSVEPATMPGRTVVPWDKDDIEVLGFFKVDVLGLGMLTAIRKALALIYAEGIWTLPGTEHPPEFNPLDVVTRIPAEEKEVYTMVSEADTVGVFQIESRAQMAMLPRLRPQKFYDLVIEVAIVRPGPIQGGMVHPYLRRRNGEENVTVPHPDLWPILKRTLGVPLFQEQVMELSIVGAGYTGGEADQLRRDMAAWKKTGRLMQHRDRLLEGFARKGIERTFSEALFEQIKGFGDYGFPESHAASFAHLVYLSSWQKALFPAHFTCAVLNSQPMGFYSPSSLVKDAQRHGVEVRGVDVMTSHWDSSLEAPSESSKIKSRFSQAQRALRLGLRLVKGLRKQAGERIVAVRCERRHFNDLAEFVRLTELKRDEVQALAEAGALESIVPERRQAMWNARAPRLTGLFSNATWNEPKVALPPLLPQQQLLLDYQRVGLSVHDHPLNHLRAALQRRGMFTATQLKDVAHQTRVQVAGLVLSRQRPATASGVVFLTLEDETGTINVVLFSKVFEQFELEARHSSLLSVVGKLERQVTLPKGDELGKPTPVIHVIAESLTRLDVPGRDVHPPSRDFQ
jgi:error-prone DNA polymerase